MRPSEGGRALGPLDTTALAAVVEEAWEREGLGLLERYTAIRCLSPAFDPSWAAAGELESAGELLRSWASSRALAGVNAELVRLPGRTPVLWVEVPATDPERAETTTLLYGHFDKQPPLGEWRTGLDPFRAVREGDCLYGRGTADDGYATPAALLALEALAATGTRHGRCVLLAEASEESGSPDLGAYLEHLADRIGRPDLVLCLDSGGPSYDCMWVTSSLRGNLVGTLSVQVLDEGVHSGAAGGVVPSSFRLLRSLLSRVEDERTGELLLAELHVETPAHRRREIEEVAAELGEAAPGLFPTVPGLMLSGSDPADRLERVTWGPALAVTGAAGLPALADAGNVLRPFTAVKLSFRLPPTCDAARAAAALERVLTADPPSRATVRFELEAPADGWDAPEPASWLAGAARSASLAYFGAPPRHVGLGGSIPFMADLGKRYPGVQFLATGVLGPASNAHGPNEALHVPTAKAITAAIAHVVASVPAYVH